MKRGKNVADTHKIAVVTLGCPKNVVMSEQMIYRLEKAGYQIVAAYSEADVIVLAVGQKPNRAAADALRNTAPEVRLLGDCLKASTLREAIFQGYHAGLDV